MHFRHILKLPLLFLSLTLLFLSAHSFARWTVSYNGEQMVIGYNGLQYGVLHRNSSYFRLVTGPDSGWGTSVVVTPSFWSGGNLYQGTAVTASWRVSNRDLLINYRGDIHTISVRGTLRISPPRNNQIRATVRVRTSGGLRLDSRPGEAYRPVFLSSMRISPSEWDSQSAFNGRFYTALPDSGLIFGADITGSRLTLDGGSNSWKTNAPTVDVYFDRSMSTMGWVTPSNDPNDDNVGYWLGTSSYLRDYTYSVIFRKHE